MFDYLIQHALKNVWCTPNQDNQVIVKPARITAINGAFNTFRLLWRRIELPEPLERFHVFQIGQIHPALLNLFAVQGKWVTIAEACNRGWNVCDIYNTQGIQYPRTQVWYMVTEDRNVLLAVKRQLRLNLDFNATDLYLRVYSNEYFASDRSIPLDDYVEVRGGTMTSTDDIIALQTWYNTQASADGGVYAFVNGYKVGAINLLTTQVGDVAEVVYDSSIRRVVDFRIQDLQTFDSILDSKGKYLLHYGGINQNYIDYFDDLDIFLIDITTQKGVYVHRNARDTLRMLTHRDYSIPVPYVSSYFHHFQDDQGGLNLGNLYLRLHIRKSGWERPLVYEHHRIDELYRLQDQDILDAMVGVDSTVPVWRADQLELSKYTQLMGSKYNQVTRQLVQDAYGYNAVATLVADTPIKRDMARPLGDIPVPYLLAFDCTVFEYDEDGLLLDSHRHTSGFSYMPRSTDCRYAEMIAGNGTHQINDVYGQDTVELEPHVNYRFYLGTRVGTTNEYTWQDVTGTGAYSVSGNTATWLSFDERIRLVRSDKTFLTFDAYLPVQEGIMALTLTQQRIIDGELVTRAMDVPMGELDLWLNGHPLIEGLDYVMRFPFIVICNKEWLSNPTVDLQKVTVRFTGFCNNELKTTPKNEFGFIQRGKISVNERYNIHRGKPQRIVCGGRLHVKEEMNFNEDNLAYEFDDMDNGKPYLIRDIVVPLRDLINTDTYEYREQSLVVDKMVEDYLTLKRPEVDDPEEINPIQQRYHLFSPFLCKIIYDLDSGALWDPQMDSHYSDEKLREWIDPYLYLLDYDPIHVDFYHSYDYMIIHPHVLDQVIDLTLPKYRLIKRVTELYANGRVNLASFIRMV